jgi:DNA-binding transcriptional ArsR family regulator
VLDEAGPRDVAIAFIADNAAPGTEETLIERVVDGDAAAFEQLMPSLGEWPETAIRDFLAGVGPSVTALRQALGAWAELFRSIEPRIAHLQEADVRSRAADVRALAPEDLIERVTGGLRFLPDANVRRIILAPSYFSRPYNHIYQGAGWRLCCYPIADAVLEAADPSIPPASMVRLHRALGDGTRIRILRLLRDRDRYLTELATELELTKPTMKHHLALLRAAGLVTVVQEGTLTYYSLRRERLEEAGRELVRYLS